MILSIPRQAAVGRWLGSQLYSIWISFFSIFQYNVGLPTDALHPHCYSIARLLFFGSLFSRLPTHPPSGVLQVIYKANLYTIVHRGLPTWDRSGHPRGEMKRIWRKYQSVLVQWLQKLNTLLGSRTISPLSFSAKTFKKKS